MAEKTLLLDGYNLAFRSYYAVPELRRADGMPTNAIQGWVRTLWSLMDQHKPAGIYVFFDLGGSQRRLEIHPEYKANRGETPEDFKVQVPFMKALAIAMGIPLIERAGVEADDLLASAAVQLSQRGQPSLMVSADKDLAQVINESIHQLLPPPTARPRLGWRLLDAAGVVEKFGLKPVQIIDYLALIGDTSDNIPGLEGVGPKTALKWLLEYGSLEHLLEKYLYVKPARFQPKLERAAERLRMNQDLIRLETDLAVDLNAEALVDKAQLIEILQQCEMNTLLEQAQVRYEKKA